LLVKLSRWFGILLKPIPYQKLVEDG